MIILIKSYKFFFSLFIHFLKRVHFSLLILSEDRSLNNSNDSSSNNETKSGKRSKGISRFLTGDLPPPLSLEDPPDHETSLRINSDDSSRRNRSFPFLSVSNHNSKSGQSNRNSSSSLRIRTGQGYSFLSLLSSNHEKRLIIFLTRDEDNVPDLIFRPILCSPLILEIYSQEDLNPDILNITEGNISPNILLTALKSLRRYFIDGVSRKNASVQGELSYSASDGLSRLQERFFANYSSINLFPSNGSLEDYCRFFSFVLYTASSTHVLVSRPFDPSSLSDDMLTSLYRALEDSLENRSRFVIRESSPEIPSFEYSFFDRSLEKNKHHLQCYKTISLYRNGESILTIPALSSDWILGIDDLFIPGISNEENLDENENVLDLIRNEWDGRALKNKREEEEERRRRILETPPSYNPFESYADEIFLSSDPFLSRLLFPFIFFCAYSSAYPTSFVYRTIPTIDNPFKEPTITNYEPILFDPDAFFCKFSDVYQAKPFLLASFLLLISYSLGYEAVYQIFRVIFTHIPSGKIGKEGQLYGPDLEISLSFYQQVIYNACLQIPLIFADCTSFYYRFEERLRDFIIDFKGFENYVLELMSVHFERNKYNLDDQQYYIQVVSEFFDDFFDEKKILLYPIESNNNNPFPIPPIRSFFTPLFIYLDPQGPEDQEGTLQDILFKHACFFNSFFQAFDYYYPGIVQALCPTKMNLIAFYPENFPEILRTFHVILDRPEIFFPYDDDNLRKRMTSLFKDFLEMVDPRYQEWNEVQKRLYDLHISEIFITALLRRMVRFPSDLKDFIPEEYDAASWITPDFKPQAIFDCMALSYPATREDLGPLVSEKSKLQHANPGFNPEDTMREQSLLNGMRSQFDGNPPNIIQAIQNGIGDDAHRLLFHRSFLGIYFIHIPSVYASAPFSYMAISPPPENPNSPVRVSSTIEYQLQKVF